MLALRPSDAAGNGQSSTLESCWPLPYTLPAVLQVAPVVKSAVETAAPVVKEGVKATVETVTPALQVRRS